MATVPADVQDPSDGELIQAVRDGSTDAYAELYQRHVSAAYNMARQVSKSPAEADDLVSESFAKVLDTLRSGRGPTVAFRAYLLTSLRHTAYDRTRRERKVQLSDDVTEVSGADVSVPFTDTAVAGLERSLAAQAFERLPERWRTVLWHVEVEGESPAQVAPLLGLTPNGVSALAYRAREGLRQAYLQVHLGQLDEHSVGVEQCRATANRLGAWIRSGLSKRETAQVENHLDGCDRCRALAAELAEVNGSLRAIIAPLLLGTSALGYLSFNGGSAAAAGAAAGSSSGAVGAASSVPRQVATSAATAAALVAGIALALTSGVETLRPTAAPPPPPPVVQPPPVAPPPVVQPPPPAPRPPKPDPAPPAPDRVEPTPPPPVTTPSMHASGPGEPLALAAGGGPESLPITVSNSGTGPSEPVTTALSLPPGITGSVPGSGASSTSGPAGTSPQSASTRSVALVRGSAAQGVPTVRCDHPSGVIRCTTDRGLNPGESFTFDFRVRADETATGGEITAEVTAGNQVGLHLSAVPVRVRPPHVDGVTIDASGWNGVPWLSSRILLDVSNVGTTTGRAEAVARLPEGVRAVGIPPECEIVPVGVREVRCSDELRPGDSFQGQIWVTTLSPTPSAWPDRRVFDTVTIPVTATLGTASDSDSVAVRLWHPWIPLPPPDDDFPPTSDQPTTSDPTTSTVPTTEPECVKPWKPVPRQWWTPELPCWLPPDSHRPPWSPDPPTGPSQPPTSSQPPTTSQTPSTAPSSTTQTPPTQSPTPQPSTTRPPTTRPSTTQTSTTQTPTTQTPTTGSPSETTGGGSGQSGSSSTTPSEPGQERPYPHPAPVPR